MRAEVSESARDRCRVAAPLIPLASCPFCVRAPTRKVWGFREHKSNFALLISLGHGEKAAIFFVGERSAMIRRSLRLVEVTADPLSYVGVLSETFFGQVRGLG